jgi:hypothetical protein
MRGLTRTRVVTEPTVLAFPSSYDITHHKEHQDEFVTADKERLKIYVMRNVTLFKLHKILC